MEAALGRALAEAPPGRATACLAIGLDGFDRLVARHGARVADEALAEVAARLGGVLRSGDVLGRLTGPIFAVALEPVRRPDLETMLPLAARLQAALDAPLAGGGVPLQVTASVGLCLAARAPRPTGRALLEAAEAALAEARRAGPAAIRAHCAEMQRRALAAGTLMAEAERALASGQIRPWFQPQVSCDTGQVSGFEALARWEHPEQGTIPPGEFLPALEAAGLLTRLGEVTLYHALCALRGWDRAGLDVPGVAVNLSADELRDPALADRIGWELDRFDIAPGRLVVEVLETVVASEDDVTLRNLAAIARLGCRIDLDDFGTGSTSIAAIRRFAPHRIKIDRSFVARVDVDAEQRRMIAAILTIAERLGVETLAEGVETPGEHATVSQLGCGHVQGYGVARPMPVRETADWLMRHALRAQAQPAFPLPTARKAG